MNVPFKLVATIRRLLADDDGQCPACLSRDWRLIGGITQQTIAMGHCIVTAEWTCGSCMAIGAYLCVDGALRLLIPEEAARR